MPQVLFVAPNEFDRLVTVGEERRQLVTCFVHLAKAKVAGSRWFDRRVWKLVFFRRLRNSAIVAHIVLVRAWNIGGTFADDGRALRGHFLDVMETRFIALGCFVVRTEDGSPELGSNQRATD